ncbi:SubName: Full=Related to RSB1-integral membrane transporter or flippase that may transport LCBs from the cytoplasmic side toward the extracytoplasmic side of the membrane {ECO:0000313/EMBL:CCA69445.1} [Serendipita indica DSM 11827]|uniref:Related to RSB1-integral membrane transporter or flippase that may transport LCBs from the cytoplasmic side toward the extracytoplasmic side of the membrane n=1 Tax=Serendipita indica (strain DSM 11827) TaxID=1109443 RepID=G4TDR0_SERID|nr:SubName: Full=Related to RSB1-integral membrane transporter or flippase that may transport LCBs from the cytoplasmic side toward the extracytoplasmic side of the membrane {ECO:0000313/EMBL:CCA69445.1} [Serendipita indica DSM 11827]CCA69445.1 related to RSB1-integral membrane transporter or flippase that may transport LCBs from the cytoplasmic side toward the extracytoplasmic side of the membrane [Serendipita indica DSM 11827]
MPYPRTPYGYVPTMWICGLFVALFGVSGIIHLAQALRWRVYWMIPTMVIGCLGEVLGWSGRLWSSKNPSLLTPFLMQITTTIISPSFMSAANFTILGRIIDRLGYRYSWLTPTWYLIIFITLDTISLVIQAIGGARASQAAETGGDPEPGGDIMLYGIVTQIIALGIYVILGADFLVRYFLDKPTRKLTLKRSTSSDTRLDEQTTLERPTLERNVKLMVLALVLNTIFLLIRGGYRTVELQDGWTGRIITNQSLFNLLDGMPIVLCTFIFNILHPGYLLRDTPLEKTKA